MAAFFVVLLFVSVEYFIRDLPIDTFFYSLRRHSLRFSDGVVGDIMSADERSDWQLITEYHESRSDKYDLFRFLPKARKYKFSVRSVGGESSVAYSP